MSIYRMHMNMYMRMYMYMHVLPIDKSDVLFIALLLNCCALHSSKAETQRRLRKLLWGLLCPLFHCIK